MHSQRLKMKGAAMSEPNGYLIHGTAFSSKEAAFKALVSNHEQESWFHKIWDEDAQPYYFESQPQLTIPKSIADELEEEIEEAYSNDYIRSYSDVGAYMEVITDGLDEDSELYKFMFPDNDALLGCSHRNIIYLYLVDNDLVKVVEG